MQPTLIVGVIIFTGYVFGQIVDRFGFPRVTGYILAGILLNPGTAHIVPDVFVQHTTVVTDIALAVITFSVGGTILMPQLRSQGIGVFLITLFEAEGAFLFVSGAFVIASLFGLVHGPLATAALPTAILMGALGAPTDPSATLAVAHEYNAKGPVSATIMDVAAFDDVFGIVNYSIAIVLAGALATHQQFSVSRSLGEPFLMIAGTVLLGAAFGLAFNLVFRIVNGESDGQLIVIILGMLLLCFGMAQLLGLESLLAMMTMGVIVTNFNPLGSKVFTILERYTEELIFVLFFTISGMMLDVTVLWSNRYLVLIFVLARTAGKVLGATTGAAIGRSPAPVRKYTAGGLIPQGGIVVGLALLISSNPDVSSLGPVVLNCTIGATVIHEVLGPLSVKLSLKRAGEI